MYIEIIEQIDSYEVAKCWDICFSNCYIVNIYIYVWNHGILWYIYVNKMKWNKEWCEICQMFNFKTLSELKTFELKTNPM